MKHVLDCPVPNCPISLSLSHDNTGPVYRKLLCDGYMHWREERLLIPPLHELPILRRYLSFISYRIWGIVSESSLLTVVNEKISLLEILLQANWHNFTLCQLLKLCWERGKTKA